MQELNLSADQKKRLQETRESVNNKKEAIENDDKLSAEQKEERLRELKRSQAREMQTILNADQREKMKTIRQEMFNKRKMDRIQQNN